MHKSLNKVIKTNVLVAIITFVAVILITSGVTYSLFQVDKNNTTDQTISIGNLSASINSVKGAVLLNDLYPKLYSELSEADKIYEFSISNDGDYNLIYNVYLKDATQNFLTENSGYGEYKALSEEYYQYINFKLDDKEEIFNLASVLNDEGQFVLFDGVLLTGKSEDHKIQFFIDKGETTTNGAPNDIAGSILSLDIYLHGGADDGIEKFSSGPETLAKMGASVKGESVSFGTQEPKPTAFRDSNFDTEPITKNMTNEQDNSFMYGESYSFNESTGLYNLNFFLTGVYSSIYSSLEGKYLSSFKGSDSYSGTSSDLPDIFKVVSATETELTYIPSTRNITYDSSKSGLYESIDDYGTSYFYRGAVENNYVKFAGFYWRILRINGNGTLRVVFDGEMPHPNGIATHDKIPLNNVSFNNVFNDAKFVGYMFGGSLGNASTKRINLGEDGYKDSGNAIYNETSSNIKVALDNWYKEHIDILNDSYYVSDTLFCNDRSFADKNTGQGFGSSLTDYSTPNRVGYDVRNNPQPSLKCPLQNDRFTVNDTKVGNGDLTYPIGTFTADEYTMAGGRYGTTAELNSLLNPVFYLYRGGTLWTMSPGGFESSNTSTGFFVKQGSVLGGLNNGGQHSVIPVINLKINFVEKMHGTGTMTDPYTID